MTVHRQDDNRRTLLERGYTAAIAYRRADKAAPPAAEAMSDQELTIAAIKLVIPGFVSTGRSADYIRGAFEGVVLPLLASTTGNALATPASTAADPANYAATSATPPTGANIAGDSHHAARGDHDVDAARAAMIARHDARASLPRQPDAPAARRQAHEEEPLDASASRAAMIKRFDLAAGKARS